MSALAKLKSNSTIDGASVLTDSILFSEKDMISTPIPAINIALSGLLDGGFVPGHTMWAGPSKHFKTGFTLLLVKAYLDAYPDAVVLFYDTEFGSPQSYFESFGIDTDRVWHVPVMNIEQLKFDMVKQLTGLSRGDKVIVVIDSIGNSASMKEVNDALNENSAADFSRAKQLKSFFRMVTPHLLTKNIPLVTINHTYKEIGTMYPKDVVGGGTGGYYSADNILILGRQQEKDDGEVIGYNFIINVEKSRYVREKSRIPISVTYDGGVSKWSGLLEMALESGHVIKPKKGWYQRIDVNTGEVEEKNYREAHTNTAEFWEPILNSQSFKDWVENKFRISNVSIVQSDEDQ